MYDEDEVISRFAEARRVLGRISRRGARNISRARRQGGGGGQGGGAKAERRDERGFARITG